MDQRHQEYLDYYRVRMEKYAGNPMFPRMYAAENAMYEAIRDAADLEEFGKRVHGEHLHVNCAVAWLYDTTKAWADHYVSLEEHVRAKPYQIILAELDKREFTDVVELNSFASDVHTKWQIPVSMDELLRTQIWSDWFHLETLETYKVAEVPQSWRAERDKWLAEEHREGNKNWREHVLVEARKFDPNFQANWSLLWESRHRRLFPFSDEQMRHRIAQYRQHVGDE